MKVKATIGIALLVLIGATLMLAITLKTRNNIFAKQNEASQLPIIIENQLETEKGAIPVELWCRPANLAASNSLSELTCTVRNNTNKAIRAVTAINTIITERNGEEYADRYNLITETFLHPDLQEAHMHNAVSPGRETTLANGPITYPDAIIKEIRIRLDYVEFEDSTTLGPNQNGPLIVAQVREGAARYKNWLAENYIASGRSMDAMLPLLQEKHGLPSDLMFTGPYQRQGARMYRAHMLELYNARGAAAVETYLSR